MASSEDSFEVELIDLTSQWIRGMEFMIPSWWMVTELAYTDIQEKKWIRRQVLDKFYYLLFVL